MWFWITIAAIIAFIGWILRANAGKSDDEIKKMRLIETARKKYPKKDLIDALDALYVSILRDIIKRKDQLYDIYEIEEDLIMLINIRNQSIKAKVEEEQLGCETMPFIKQSINQKEKIT